MTALVLLTKVLGVFALLGIVLWGLKRSQVGAGAQRTWWATCCTCARTSVLVVGVNVAVLMAGRSPCGRE